MSGKIQKVDRTQRRQAVPQPKIVGGKSLSGSGTEIVDQRTKQPPVQIETKSHGDLVTVESYTRRKPRKKNEPDVRLRTMTPDQKSEWEAVKSLQWENE